MVSIAERHACPCTCCCAWFCCFRSVACACAYFSSSAAASDAADADFLVRPARISRCAVTWFRPGDILSVTNALAPSVFEGIALRGD